MSRSHNLDAGEDRISRGVKRQKYPLDDYLINNTNLQTLTQASLLSPVSPVSSPETVDVLQNAERLVKSAQKQIMEVSFNSALNTLDENSLHYMEQQPLDESLLYVRKMVDSKFQESNDPNRIYISEASLNTKLQDDVFPVKESTGMLNKPLQISQQNSEFSAGQMMKGIFFENEKPFFNKAPNWFNIKPPEHIDVFPTSTIGNFKTKTRSSCTVPCCTITNTGVIEINGTDLPNGNMQVQTGPTVDIRGGLTIQTIENVHISPDPSSAPIYNNIATYCFKHEPSTSTSFVDSNTTPADKQNITSSSARDSFDTRKERHIQSTDYNDTHKIAPIENTHNTDITVVKDSIDPSHDTNQDTIGKQTMLNNDSNYHSHSNEEMDLSSARNQVSSEDNVIQVSNVRKSSLVEILRESVDNPAQSANSKKTAGKNFTPIVTSAVHQEFSITDAQVESEDEEENISYGGQEFGHVHSHKEYVQRSHVCRDECRTASCSRKCERDVAYREKQKLKEALETIANIEKLKFDIKDTGIIPTECTQICNDRNGCNADMVNFELTPFSGPECFKAALENLCKFSQNNRASEIDTNSEVYQGAIDAFVKMFFDPNSQFNTAHGVYTPDQVPENEDTASRQNKQSTATENAEIEKQEEVTTKPPTPVKLIPKNKETKYRQRPSKILDPKSNNVNHLSTTKNNASASPIRQKELNKYSKPVGPENSQLPKDKIARQEKAPLATISSKKENSLENLDLKQPCTSDIDAVLETYRESMAFITHGTEQLSQLISHHIMKNAVSPSEQISASPIPDLPTNLSKMNVEPRNASNVKITAKPVSNLVSYGTSKVPRQSESIFRKNSRDQPSIQKTCCNQIQSTKVAQEKVGHARISRCDNPSASRDEAEFSNENNSASTNETRVSTCSISLSEQAKTLSNTDEKSSPVLSIDANDTSHSRSTSKVSQQTPVNVRTKSARKQSQRDVKNVCKSGGKPFMNVQYCITEPFEAPIPMEVTSDKKNSFSQSGLKTPLSTYLHLEDTCGKDIKLRRHSNFDIHSEQTGEFDLYKCPVLISGHRGNFETSDNDSNDKLTGAETVARTREIELQVFGQVLEAVKNSSQFMERIVVSLFNGTEIGSIHDIVRNLEDAAVHPIIIEQFLMILNERNRDKSLFGGNLMLRNPEPISDDRQKNYNVLKDLPKTGGNINSFEHSVGFNRRMETTNIHINKADEDPVALHPGGDQITITPDPTQWESNLDLEMNKDRGNSIHYHNSLGNEAPENTSPSGQVGNEISHEKHEESKNSRDNLAILKTTVESKSHIAEPSLTLPCSILQAPASEEVIQQKSQQDCEEAKEKLLEVKNYQCNGATSEEQSNTKECSTNSMSSNGSSKNNDSESNTDKDISFSIPHDADVNNEVVDLSSVQKLTSVTLKNETTGEIIGIHTERNRQNRSRLNSHAQDKSSKINSNSDPGQSSAESNKKSGKLQNSVYSTLNDTNLTQMLQTDEHNIVCHCQRPKDQNVSNIESNHVPCASSIHTVNAIIDFQIQSNYKQLGLIDSEQRPVRRISNKTTPPTETTLNKRPSPSKLSATSKSPVRKANTSSRPGGKKKKSFDKKVIRSKKVFRDHKQGSVKNVQSTEISDSAKSDFNDSCPLCIQLEGNCSCPDQSNNITSLKRDEKMSPKSKNEKAKLIKNKISPRQSGSAKRSGQSGDKYPLNSKDNGKKTDHSQGIPKNNKKSGGARKTKNVAHKAPKAKLKQSSGTLSSSSNNNDGLMNREEKPTKDKKLFQDAASDSDNLKVEDKSQNTANCKTGDATACKSTETQNMVISAEITVCKSTRTLCKKLTILDQVSRLLPKNPNNIVEINTVDKPETISRCTEMRDFSTMGCQTPEISNNLQQHQPNPSEAVTEAGTVSVCRTARPNIFDDESIIVLQPLNELDHTFFIAKPNCVQRKMIQEKLNERLNVQVRETTDQAHPSVDELNEHHEETNKELTYPNCEIGEQVNSNDEETIEDSTKIHNTTSTISCVENKECQAGCPGGMEMEDPIYDEQSIVPFAPMHVTDSNGGILENEEACSIGLCTNDEECLRICSQPPLGSDDSKNRCKQDCPNEEICLTLCPPVSQAEPPLQTSSININGILKKFIAENNVPEVKLPIVKGLLEELKNVENSLKGRSEEGSDHGNIEYEESHAKLKGIMLNRKSLVLPNVVREIADMNPSTRLEHLRLRSADPLVSGNFNKPESDRRYSVFNQADPQNSTININDPKTQAHLAAIAQRPNIHEEKESSSNSSADIAPSITNEMNERMPTVEKSKSNTTSKLNKSRRGMDADSNFFIGLNKRSVERDNNSLNSFESSDLEPGEFLQVRTPFDNTITLRQSSERTDLEIGEVSLGQLKCNGLCNNDRSHSQSVKNENSTNDQKTTSDQCQTLENKYELSMDSPEALSTRKEHRRNSDRFIHKSDSVSPDTVKSVKNGSQRIFGKKDSEFGVSNRHSTLDKTKHLEYVTTADSQFNDQSYKLKIDKNSNAMCDANFMIVSGSSSAGSKSHTLKVIEKHTRTEVSQYSRINNSHDSEVDEDPHRIINKDQNIDHFHKYSERFPSETECSDRPQIIDHFLGKRKLEDLKIEYINYKTDTMSKECQRLGGNCQRLYLKSDFTSKTTPDSENSNIMDSPDLFTTRNNVVQFNVTSRIRNNRSLANFKETTRKDRDQTSSDTYSEGEINLPSSCSYSLGEVKISTPSSTTVGKSFKDPDGLTIFVTKSILDSTYATCTSPGEILADIQKMETDFSSSIS